MKNVITVTGKLQIIEKLKNSTMGNPKYLVGVVDDNHNLATFYTATNSSHGYSITNYEGKNVEVTLKTVRGKPTLQTIKEI